MKRFILSAFLAVTIVGLTVVSICSKSEVDAMMDSTLVDLVGNKDVLGNVKLISATNLIDDYEYVETVASKKGIESTGVRKGNFYDARETQGSLEKIDKDLLRGLDTRNSASNEKFSVALSYDEEKGITVRYRNLNDNKKREFNVEGSNLKQWLDISNIYLRDDLLYMVLGDYSESYLFKINLATEKLEKKIDFPKDFSMARNNQGSNTAEVKGNKMYIISHNDTSIDSNTFEVITFDLDKEVFQRKIINCKKYDEVHMYSIEPNGEYAYYYNFEDKKNILDIVVYNMISDKLVEISIDYKQLKGLNAIRFSNCKIIDNKLYLSGTTEEYSEYVGKNNAIICVFDLNNNSLEYLGTVKNDSLGHFIITDIK